MARVEDFIFDGRQACLNESPELFFEGAGDDILEAKSVCRLCPVREACLMMAIANEEKHGIWGGLTTQERKELKAGPRSKARRRVLVESSAA